MQRPWANSLLPNGHRILQVLVMGYLYRLCDRSLFLLHLAKQGSICCIQGSVAKGDVVAFYPGCVYAEADMPLVYPHIFMDNTYLTFRSDKVRC